MAKKFAIEISGYDDVQPFESGAKERSLHSLVNYLRGLLAGRHNGSVSVRTFNDLVSASGTVTLANVSAADTVTINGTTFTGVTSGATGAQFNTGGTDSADADSLVTAVNAHTTVGALVTATNANGVVTLTAKNGGVEGNAITLASSNGTRLAVSAARLSGGSETNVNFTF